MVKVVVVVFEGYGGSSGGGCGDGGRGGGGVPEVWRHIRHRFELLSFFVALKTQRQKKKGSVQVRTVCCIRRGWDNENEK